ncbi:centrosomal protein of 41 kDa isoform 2-T4 [Alca torda]
MRRPQAPPPPPCFPRVTARAAAASPLVARRRLSAVSRPRAPEAASDWPRARRGANRSGGCCGVGRQSRAAGGRTGARERRGGGSEMSSRRGVGDPEYLTRRIPQNPRYQHIKTRLDTGNSLTKYTEKLEEIKRNYRYKKDELFKRLKVTTFAQLVIQVASLSDETLEVTNEEIHKLEDGDSVAPGAEVTAGTNGKGSPDGTPSPVLFINNTGAGESHRSTLQSVISGVGELDIEKDTPKKVDAQAKDMPYPDCPFLLLDVRDQDAYDQCHIIGGLKVLAQKIPEGLITGSLPVSCQVAAPPGSARKKTSPKVPPTRAENKWRFTADDLQKIKYYLEEEHIPSDTASHLSRGSSGRSSKVTTVRSSATGNVASLTARSFSRSSLQNRPWK